MGASREMIASDAGHLRLHPTVLLQNPERKTLAVLDRSSPWV